MDDIRRIRANVNERASLTGFCFPLVIDAWLTGGKVDKKTLVDAVRHLGKALQMYGMGGGYFLNLNHAHTGVGIY